jgi:hypothetical protein
MLDHKARNRRFASLATVTTLAVVLAACSANVSAGAAGKGFGGSAVQTRLEGDPYQAGTRAPGPTVKQTRATIQMGRTGIHPGGGGPQK